MHSKLSVIEVARYVRVYEPVSASMLSRLMGESEMRVRRAATDAQRMGFIRRLPGDKRWWIVRMG